MVFEEEVEDVVDDEEDYDYDEEEEDYPEEDDQLSQFFITCSFFIYSVICFY